MQELKGRDKGLANGDETAIRQACVDGAFDRRWVEASSARGFGANKRSSRSGVQHAAYGVPTQQRRQLNAAIMRQE